MKKHLKKCLIGASMTLTGMTALLILFILYPNNLFAKKTAYKTFTIYSAQPLQGEHQSVLDKAIELVEAAELYDPAYRYDIFLTEGTTYKSINFQIMGPALARSLDNNIMLNIDPDFRKNLLTGSANKRNLTRTIAHEMVHCLQLNRYGIRKFNPMKHPPLWKLEGYPEYIAYADEIQAPGYQFTQTVDRLRRLEQENTRRVEMQPGHFDPIVYFKGRVLVEYLMGIKGLSYDEVLDENIHAAEVYYELLAWRNAR